MTARCPSEASRSFNVEPDGSEGPAGPEYGKGMRRQPIRNLGLILTVLLSLPSGCTRPPVRGSDPLEFGATTPPAALLAGPLDEEEDLAAEARGFFKPSRLSGAWSSEAAEIEESLGIPR